MLVVTFCNRAKSSRNYLCTPEYVLQALSALGPNLKGFTFLSPPWHCTQTTAANASVVKDSTVTFTQVSSQRILLVAPKRAW